MSTSPRDAAIRVMTLVTDDQHRAEELVGLLLAAARIETQVLIETLTPVGQVPKGTVSDGHAFDCATQSKVLKHMPCDCPLGLDGDYEDRVDRVTKALEKAYDEGVEEGRKSPLTDRQREGVWRLLTFVFSWTSSRYDQHLRHFVGDEDTDAILEWLRDSVNSGIGDPDIDGPPGDPVLSDDEWASLTMPVDQHRTEVAKLLIAAGLHPHLDVAKATPLLEVMAKERFFYGQGSTGPVNVHQPCERGARGECETCHQADLAQAAGKKPVPKGTSYVPCCKKCGKYAMAEYYLDGRDVMPICNAYPNCKPAAPSTAPLGSAYCARSSCRHSHRDMLRCTQCPCLVFMEIYDPKKPTPHYPAPDTVTLCWDEESEEWTTRGAIASATSYKRLDVYNRVVVALDAVLKVAKATPWHRNVNAAQHDAALIAAEQTRYQVAGQVPERTMHWLIADRGFGAGKTYCGRTQGEDVYGTPDGNDSDCLSCFTAARTGAGQAAKPAPPVAESKPKLEEAVWVLDKDAVARAHGWTWWTHVVEDSQKDGYEEAGGRGNLAAAIGKNAAYAQKLIELVDGYEKP